MVHYCPWLGATLYIPAMQKGTVYMGVVTLNFGMSTEDTWDGVVFDSSMMEVFEFHGQVVIFYFFVYFRMLSLLSYNLLAIVHGCRWSIPGGVLPLFFGQLLRFRLITSSRMSILASTYTRLPAIRIPQRPLHSIPPTAGLGAFASHRRRSTAACGVF